MDNLSDPVSIIILSAMMGLLGGLIAIPIHALASRMLKGYEQENQHKLDIFARKQELLLQHRLELQRQNETDIKASIAQLKTVQKRHSEEINHIAATAAENAAEIRNSLTVLGQKTVSLTAMGSQTNERLNQMEKSQAEEASAPIAQIETRLAKLEELHDPLQRDS